MVWADDPVLQPVHEQQGRRHAGERTGGGDHARRARGEDRGRRHLLHAELVRPGEADEARGLPRRAPARIKCRRCGVVRAGRMPHRHQGPRRVRGGQVPQRERGVLHEAGPRHLRVEAVVRDGHQRAKPPRERPRDEVVFAAPARPPIPAVDEDQQRCVGREGLRRVEVVELARQRPVGQPALGAHPARRRQRRGKARGRAGGERGRGGEEGEEASEHGFDRMTCAL